MKVIVAAVVSDSEKYNEAFLGKPAGEYCQWILNPEKWGGLNLWSKDAYVLYILLGTESTHILLNYNAYE